MSLAHITRRLLDAAKTWNTGDPWASLRALRDVDQEVNKLRIMAVRGEFLRRECQNTRAPGRERRYCYERRPGDTWRAYKGFGHPWRTKTDLCGQWKPIIKGLVQWCDTNQEIEPHPFTKLGQWVDGSVCAGAFFESAA